MKKLFNQKLLVLALSLIVFSACDDDEKIVTKGEFTVNDQTTKISSGLLVYDTSPQEDANENTYYRNQLIFLGKGLTIVGSDGEYDLSGDGSLLELLVNNEDQVLQAGEYTWQSEENEQPFDLWSGELTLHVNSGDEEVYQLQSGTVTVTKSGSIHKITFSGTAYLQFSEGRGLPPLEVTAEFEGKLKRLPFDF
jgi:hypothetical protein